MTQGIGGTTAGDRRDNRMGDGAVASGSSNPVAPRDDEGIAAPGDSEKTTQRATRQRYHTRHSAQGIQACHSHSLGHNPAELTHSTSACHPIRTAFASNADQSRGCKSRMPMARRPTCSPNTTQSFQQSAERKLKYAPRNTPSRVAECAVDWARNLTRVLVNGARPDPEWSRSSISGSPTYVGTRSLHIHPIDPSTNIVPSTPSLDVQSVIPCAERILGGKFNDHATLERLVDRLLALRIRLTHVVQVQNDNKGTWFKAVSYKIVPIWEGSLRGGQDTLTSPQNASSSLIGWPDLVFDYALRPDTLDPKFGKSNLHAARTNAFYVINMMHDIAYTTRVVVARVFTRAIGNLPIDDHP
ncbi:hypothetical protein BD779DRAFT_1801855 [Infundibulicybe gibba]|nr:hypothetical protein BD779DRAFT_1801855 [Infundibulicybe gibba]